MSTLARVAPVAARQLGDGNPMAVRLGDLGERTPIGRPGGQGRVYRAERTPAALGTAPVVVKLYRRPPTAAAVDVLAEMIAWSRALDPRQRAHLHRVAAWPLAIVTASEQPVGIAMHDVSGSYEVPFLMPSGRRQQVLLSLEHLLGADDYLQLRGLGLRLDTAMRATMAARISGALASLHRHGIVASDISPNNLLVGVTSPTVCFIDCDSMVFHGRQALPSVETADWQVPAQFAESPDTRAADAYKLGLVVLRLFARSHDARVLTPHVRHVPSELRGLVSRSLDADAANRPPAGEWQRALREVLARGGLNERYPGPAPARPVAPRTDSAVATRPRRYDPLPPSPPPRRAPAHGQPAPARRRGGGRTAVGFAYVLVAAVIFIFLLSRLFAVAAQSAGAGSGLSAPEGGQGPTHYYYVQPGEQPGEQGP